MSVSPYEPPRCFNCQAVRSQPIGPCQRCGAPPVQPANQAGRPPARPKSVAVAVLLTVLLLGGGHLYLGKTSAGAAFAVGDAVLAMISLTGIGLVLTVPVRITAVIVLSTMAASDARTYNRVGHF